MPGTFGTQVLWRGPYAMIVVGSEQDGDSDSNRWVYTLKPVDWGSDYLSGVTSLTTAANWDKCINLWEINNTPTQAMGLTVENDGPVLQPAPNNAIVMAHIMPGPLDSNNIPALVVFQWPNQWECPE